MLTVTITSIIMGFTYTSMTIAMWNLISRTGFAITIYSNLIVITFLTRGSAVTWNIASWTVLAFSIFGNLIAWAFCTGDSVTIWNIACITVYAFTSIYTFNLS